MTTIPSIAGEQMAQVDRIMIDDLGLDVLQLMEVAGLAVATLACDRMLDKDALGKRVTVLCGTGGNGGDGLVAGRFLHGWGATVHVVLSQRPDPNRGIAADQLDIVERMGLSVEICGETPHLPECDLIIDALLGFSLSGAPNGTAAMLIRAANSNAAPVLAVDLPSGLAATTGEVLNPCISAHTTLTLALPKTGLLAAVARPVVGELYVADIGVPPEVYRRFGLNVGHIFSNSRVMRCPY